MRFCDRCLLICSMRAVRRATCTSEEPVSASCLCRAGSLERLMFSEFL